MAATTELARQFDRDLRLISADIADLPERDALWEDDRKSGGTSWRADWDAWDYEWRNNSAIIETLSEHYRKRQMSSDQERRYEDMLESLRNIVPVLERLGYTVPSVLSDQPSKASH